ncbi:hypothetical protein O7635_29595 [Asanoa sp. WMMD1127]|uniref:hypothetical protein n=1 Tax=Asanoa sp. WMMD1127 TaxID=3016107 RepID=UPI00241651F2|nr:hypothetical protein [Asanoa sp. WMMD1127]MDG4826024.1 hypothetical protein [Asanoa sp. WMMD1127]
MRIRILFPVPGLLLGRILVPGDEIEVEPTTAVSLMEDGYAEMIGPAAVGRATPAERRETADAAPRRGPGRPRKEG